MITEVTSGSNLQGALDAAKPGDELVLDGAFTGNFVLPVKSGDAPITIRGKSDIPTGRISATAVLPKIISVSADPALYIPPGSHHWKLIGIEIVQGSAYTYDLLRIGDGRTAGEQRTIESVPHHIVIDRCIVRAKDDASEVQRGIALHGAYVDITNCHISGHKMKGVEAQAIGGWNGVGPYKIVNNYLEGAGENLILGGAAPAIPNLCPTDIEVLRNHLFKPLHWSPYSQQFFRPLRGQSVTWTTNPMPGPDDDPDSRFLPRYVDALGNVAWHWTVKNLLEFKHGKRVKIIGNKLENNWKDAQNGMAVLFTPRPNDSGIAAVVEDVEYVSNQLLNVAGGITAMGIDNLYPTRENPDMVVRLKRIRIANSEIKVNSLGNGGNGRPLQVLSGTDSAMLDRLTIENDGESLMMVDGVPLTSFVMRGVLGPHRLYGIKGGGTDSGKAALDVYAPNGVYENNLIYDETAERYATRYPAGFTLTASLPTTLPQGVGVDRAALEAASKELTEMPPLPTEPDVMQVQYPTTEAAQSRQWQEMRVKGYSPWKHLTGPKVEYRKWGK